MPLRRGLAAVSCASAPGWPGADASSMRRPVGPTHLPRAGARSSRAVRAAPVAASTSGRALAVTSVAPLRASHMACRLLTRGAAQSRTADGAVAAVVALAMGCRMAMQPGMRLAMSSARAGTARRAARPARPSQSPTAITSASRQNASCSAVRARGAGAAPAVEAGGAAVPEVMRASGPAAPSSCPPETPSLCWHCTNLAALSMAAPRAVASAAVGTHWVVVCPRDWGWGCTPSTPSIEAVAMNTPLTRAVSPSRRLASAPSSVRLPPPSSSSSSSSSLAWPGASPPPSSTSSSSSAAAASAARRASMAATLPCRLRLPMPRARQTFQTLMSSMRPAARAKPEQRRWPSTAGSSTRRRVDMRRPGSPVSSVKRQQLAACQRVKQASTRAMCSDSEAARAASCVPRAGSGAACPSPTASVLRGRLEGGGTPAAAAHAPMAVRTSPCSTFSTVPAASLLRPRCRDVSVICSTCMRRTSFASEAWDTCTASVAWRVEAGSGLAAALGRHVFSAAASKSGARECRPCCTPCSSCRSRADMPCLRSWGRSPGWSGKAPRCQGWAASGRATAAWPAPSSSVAVPMLRKRPQACLTMALLSRRRRRYAKD